MKAEVLNPKIAEFRPITVEITIDSPEDLARIKRMARGLVPSEIAQIGSASEYTYEEREALVRLVETIGHALDPTISPFYGPEATAARREEFSEEEEEGPTDA